MHDHGGNSLLKPAPERSVGVVHKALQRSVARGCELPSTHVLLKLNTHYNSLMHYSLMQKAFPQRFDARFALVCALNCIMGVSLCVSTTTESEACL
jgi:hypothetical protein